MKQIFLINAQIVLILTLISASQLTLAANEIDNLQPGHWYEVPNSKLNQLCPEDNAQGHGYAWSAYCAGIINAWSGGAYDTKRDRLLVWGGGHGDYAGNEVYGFDVDTLSWQQITQPSDLSDGCDGFGWYGECPGGETMPDGKPIARHTYDGVEYIPELDKLWAAGGSRWPGGQLSDATWTLDLANTTWVRKKDTPEKSWYYTIFSAYDAVTKNVFSFGQDSLLMHNPVTDQWTELTSGDSFFSDSMTAEIDPERRKMVVIGDGLAYYYDLSDLQNVTRKDLVTTGDNSILNAKAPSLVYDSKSKTMIAWSGEPDKDLQPQDVYELDLDSFQWTKRSPAATNTVIPSKSNSQGTYGRFRYIPSKNAFIVVNAVDENVYFYKLPLATVVAPDADTSDLNPVVPADVDDSTHVMQEDAEDQNTDAWEVYTNKLSGEVSNIVDPDNSTNRVIQLQGSGTDTGFRYTFATPDSDNTSIEWKMKYSEAYTVYISVQTTLGHRYLYYTSVDYDALGSGRYVHHGLGPQTQDGQWHTIKRNLLEDLQDAQPGNSIVSIDAILIRGSGLVDDIKTLTADTIPEVTDEEIPETTEIFDINGWEVYTNKLSGKISNIVDPDDSTNRVIQLQGSGTDTGFRYSFATPDSDNTSIEWKMKYSEAYTVYISVQTTLGHRYLYYTSVDYDALGSGRYVHHGLGPQTQDGQWHTIKRNLLEDLQDAQSGNSIVSIDAFLVRGSGLIDDIKTLNGGSTPVDDVNNPSNPDSGTPPVNTETEGNGELPTLSVLEAHPAHIAGINHSNELVSVGVPLQQGTGITSVNQLELQGASANQFRALSHYPNGEIRWLNVDFLADVSTGGNSQVTLIKGSATTANNLAQETENGATVDTGVAKFVIDKNSASILSSAIVGGVEQLAESMVVYSIKDGQEFTSLADNNTQVSIEENGSVTTIIRVDGRLKKKDGAGHFWYTARLHFVKNSSDVKTDLTIRNASQEVLTAQNYDGYGVRFVMVNDNPKVTFVADDGDSWQDTLVAQESALIYQGYVDNHPFNQNGLTDCYTWQPTVAGTCSSDFAYDFAADNKGVRVVMAGNTEQQGGNDRSVAYAKVESGSQTITLAQRWMANYFPASFEINGDGQVDIGLHSRYSGKNNQTFNWGGHITREFTIAFASTDSAAVRHKLDWPLVARADFEYYRNAKAMLGDNRMVSFTEEEDYFSKYNSLEPHSIKPVEAPGFTVKRFTHWRRNYTDRLKDVVDFWRGGSPMYMARVLQYAGYETDIAIAHSDGFDLAQDNSLAVPYGEERGIHKYDSEHQLTRYLPIAYYLTGSERIHQAIIDYGEDQLFDERANYFAFPEAPYYRAWLRRFENFSWLYGFTEDNRYLEEVKSGIDLLVDSQAVDGEVATRGQDKSRGFLNMAVAAGFDQRVVHNFFGAQISGEAYFQVMRIMRQTGINYKIEDLEDVVLGQAFFLYREMMRNEDGTTSGITYDYFVDQANPNTGFSESVYVADRYLQHIYDMFGIDHVDGVDLFAQAFKLNYERGTNVYLPGMMSNGQQQALMYTDLFRPAPKHGYQTLDTTARKNADGTYTLSWVVPEGAKSYRIKASKKPIVEWLGYNKTIQQYTLAKDDFVPWFAAQNLQNEPAPATSGTVQSWTVNELPTNGNWFFSVHYSTQQERPGVL